MLWTSLVAAWAHPSADAHLEATAQAVDADPCALELRLDRARALDADGRTDEALSELAAAEACGVDPLALDVHRGVVLHHHPQRALPFLDRALQAMPSHLGARATRAEVLTALGRPDDALADWLVVVEGAPSPDSIIAAAELARTVGDDAMALALLDAGHQRLGATVLRRAAIELALERGQNDGALARLAGTPETAPWWHLRARVLRAAGHGERADQATSVAHALEGR